MDCYVLSAWWSESLIIPDLWCNISMSFSLIGGSVVALPLSDSKDLHT
jgi:hypothetical protein